MIARSRSRRISFVANISVSERRGTRDSASLFSPVAIVVIVEPKRIARFSGALNTRKESVVLLAHSVSFHREVE